MSTITTEVQICNSALIKLGVEPISALSETNNRARVCNKQYPLLRDEVLHSHPWNFAIARTQLAKTGNTPAFNFDFEYLLPSDYFRILEVDENRDGRVDFQIEYNADDGNKVLLTDKNPLKIKYIRQVTDVTQFSPAFAEALALRLAMDLAISLRNSRAMAEYYARLYEQWASRARSYDAQEGSVTQLITTTWTDARK